MSDPTLTHRPDLEAALRSVESGECGACEAELLRSALAVAEMSLIQKERQLKEMAARLRVYQLADDAPLVDIEVNKDGEIHR